MVILIILKEECLTLEVGGDFSNNDATTGFVWEKVIHLQFQATLILLLLILSTTALLMLLTLDLLALLKLQQVHSYQPRLYCF